MIISERLKTVPVMEKKSQVKELPKVLYVSANGYLGGAERVVLSAAKGHLQRGNFTPLILFFSDGEAVKEAREAGIECFVLKSRFKLSEPRSLVSALAEIRGLVKQSGATILHHTMSYSHLVSSLATLGLGLKKVWFQHGPVGGILDKLASFFAVDKLFFNSDFLRELHHRSFPHSKIRRGEEVIKLGVTSSDVRERSPSDKTLVFGTAGRICKGKAFHEIIASLESTGNPFRLLVAGAPKSPSDQAYLESLKDLVQKLPPGMEVRFLGHVQDMPKFYGEVDVFIHASETPEPFGLVIAEAMAHGCLAVARKQGGARDFLVNGKNSLTYDSWNDLTGVLNRIQRELSQDNFEAMAREGQRVMREKHSYDNMIRQIEKSYLELLA